MRLELESTDEVALVNGVPARAWHGITGRDIEVTAWIPLIRARSDQDLAQLDDELIELVQWSLPEDSSRN